jgi:hypothetical protein
VEGLTGSAPAPPQVTEVLLRGTHTRQICFVSHKESFSRLLFGGPLMPRPNYIFVVSRTRSASRGFVLMHCLRSQILLVIGIGGSSCTPLIAAPRESAAQGPLRGALVGRGPGTLLSFSFSFISVLPFQSLTKNQI